MLDYAMSLYALGLIALLAFFVFAAITFCMAVGEMAADLLDEFKRLTNWR